MVGGTANRRVHRPTFQTLAPQDGYRARRTNGAGHFVKMVHNGIEYGMMQAYGEGFELLKASQFDLDLAQVAQLWKQGSVVRSWLLELCGERIRTRSASSTRSKVTSKIPAKGAGRSGGDRTGVPRRSSRFHYAPVSRRASRSRSPPRCRPRCETSSAATR